MKKLIVILTIFCSTFILVEGNAQTNSELLSKPYIEVTGTHEMQIVPDEIYVEITIQERVEGKTKITIEEQLEELKKGISELGIDLKNLNLSNSQSNYIKIKWGKKDVLNRSEFVVKLKTAEETGKVFMLLDKLDLQNARILKVDHSEKVELQKQARILAIKAAKDKANYLLEAIGQKPGKAILVKEHKYSDYMENTNGIYSRVAGVAQSTYSIERKDKTKEIGFKKITLRSSMYVIFEIEQ
ncbi:MAG: hypothetical protein CL840_06180 [Crocinitomicaceae bacterium]|nr:hypothetical protein [Crocinitomicaceae bacterium]|tara:strand:- start:2132 stop:2857 length:726 start_codon:yes stop_codon:yes gene_type:complete